MKHQIYKNSKHSKFSLFCILFLLVFGNCSKSELINEPIKREIDTVFTKIGMDEYDNEEHQKVPIGFDVNVENWDYNN